VARSRSLPEIPRIVREAKVEDRIRMVYSMERRLTGEVLSVKNIDTFTL
jgi:hypothetical protein